MGRRVELNRRQFLRFSAFTATSATLAACSALDILPHAQTVTTMGDLEQSGFHFVARGTSRPWKNPLRTPSRRQERHTKQKIQSMAIDAISTPVFGPMLDWAFCQCGLQERAPLTNDNARVVEVTKREMILFNVLVALEWTPDEAYLGQLQSAFAQASDLLYDVTDGYMTFGQVVIGGPELMDVADFQIFASNRLFPRSSVNGLTIPHKYQPIRLGRGLWNKRQRETIQWDQSDDTRSEFGPQTLVHEWGHYALGMKDQYLRLEEQRFVVPTLSHVAHTIMADLKTSELSTRGEDDDNEWQLLSIHPQYQSLGIAAGHQPREAAEPLVPMPAFYITGTADGAGQPLGLGRQDPAFTRYAMDPKHCWVYIMKGADISNPDQLIAQGSYTNTPSVSDAQVSGNSGPTGFPLLGAAHGDFVLLIGSENNKPAQPLVLWSQIQDSDRGMAVMGAWFDATPDSFPIVDVIATSNAATPPFSIKLSGFDTTEWNAITFPLGQQEQGQHLKKMSAFVDGLQALDGHVMLISRTGRAQLAIANYSLGGSPSTSFPVGANPIPAGSSDGNAMIFFYDSQQRALRYDHIYRADNGAEGQSFDSFRVVTTTNLQNNQLPPQGWTPRSYAFTITTNRSFHEVKDLNPTLVLYFDEETLSNGDGDLIIGRYDRKANQWVSIDIQMKPHDFLAAASLTSTTAPGLYDKTLAAEHYRLFLIR